MIPRYSPKDISAVWTDEQKFANFLEIEILACEAFEKLKMIPAGVSARMRKNGKISVNKILEIEKTTQHDIVAFLWDLSESIGKDAQYLHWGMTSSDLLDTSLGLQIKQASEIILADLDVLIKETAKKAKAHKDTVCVGRTHGVHAEVYSAGLKFALFYDELVRGRDLLKAAIPTVCVGAISGAVGNFAYLDPKVEEHVCKKLGLGVAKISTQVISRDRYAYYMSVLAMIASVLERFTTEVRHLHKNECKEMEEPFYKGQKGSSAMPHKKNPIVCERVAGLARLVRSNMHAAYENINLWHERDISHSSCERVILPDSTIALVYILRKVTDVVRDMPVHKDNMLRNLYSSGGIVFSQGFLTRLMTKGLERKAAYDMVQAVALEAQTKRSDFVAAVKENVEMKKYLSDKEILELTQPAYYLRNVGKIFARLGLIKAK
jgi:adenylosuccinate lyase